MLSFRLVADTTFKVSIPYSFTLQYYNTIKYIINGLSLTQFMPLVSRGYRKRPVAWNVLIDQVSELLLLIWKQQVNLKTFTITPQISVQVWSFSRIFPYSILMWENMDQNNSEYGHFLCSVRPATLLKNRLWHTCFPENFAKFIRTSFLQDTWIPEYRLLLIVMT